MATVNDNFNRSNGAIGSNWTTALGASASPTILSNRAHGAASVTAAYWSANAWDNDQSAAVQLAGSYDSAAPFVRGSASADTCYTVNAIDEGEGWFGFRIQKRVAGTTTLLGTLYETDAFPGYMRLTVTGTSLVLAFSSNGTSWTDVVTATDSAIASGHAGIRFVNTACDLDNFTGTGAQVSAEEKFGTTTVTASSSVTVPAGVKDAPRAVTVTAAGDIDIEYSKQEAGSITQDVTVTGTASVTVAGRHAALHSVSVSATGTVTVGVPEGDNILDLEIAYAAFGDDDPYAVTKFTAAGKPEFAVAKGVICRPGARIIGKRVDINAGDRVMFHVPHSALLGDASHLARRVKFFVTPLHVLTWDRSALVIENLFKVRRVDTALDLATCSAASALAATLSGDYATITAENVWLSGGTGMPIPPGNTTVPTGRAIDPWELDLTALYNDALTRGVDLRFCLECVATSNKTSVELFGSEHPLLRPRLEVQEAVNGNIGNGSGLVITITEIDSCTPVLTITNSVPASLASYTIDRIAYGYDAKYGRDITNRAKRSADGQTITIQMPPLETSARVAVQIDLIATADSNAELRFRRTFKTPKAPAARITLPSRVYSWQDVRGPCPIDTPEAGEAYIVLAKSGGGTGEPAAGTWRFWRCTNHGGNYGTPATPEHGAFVFMPLVGGSDLSPFGDQPDPDQNAAAHPANDLVDFTADDVSAPFYDFGNQGMLYFLRSDFNGGTGLYDIKLVEVWNSVGELNNWFTGAWPAGFDVRTSPTLYSATAAPNLKLAAITRDTDWRSARSQSDTRGTIIVAFVADGALKIMEQSEYEAADSPQYGVDYYAGLHLDATWDLVYDEATTINGSLSFSHALSEKRVVYSILFGVTASGNCTLGRRAADSFAFNAGADDWDRTAGTWYVSTAIPNYKAGFVTQPRLAMTAADIPDSCSCFVAIIQADGTTKLYLPSNLTQSPGQPQIAPANYGPGNVGFSQNTQLVERWPSAFAAMSRTALGGAIGFRVASGVLYAQRVSDILRVASEKSVTLSGSVTGTTIHAIAASAWEGQQAPVIVGAPGAWQVAAVGTMTDLTFMDAPTIDLVERFSSGAMTVANFQAPQSNMHLTGLRKLPGHNAFGMTFPWDPDSYDYGIMNNAGTFQFKLTGVLGEVVRIHMHNAASNATFVDGALRPAITDWDFGSDGSAGEALGGEEWPFVKWSTWFYTYDPPGTPDRRWRRVWDRDYVTDGESGGGIEVLQPPPFEQNDVWIGHEMSWDITHWKGLVTYWRARSANSADPAYGKVRNVNSLGEFLHDNGQVASQVFTDVNGRAMTTWVEGPSGVNNGAGSNFLGLMISDPAYSRGSKKLIVLQATEDCEEQTAGYALADMINELLSGSSLSHTLLRVYDFFVFPFQNQVGAERGWSRYQYDTRRENGLIVHHQLGEPWVDGGFPWQGESWLGTEFQIKVIEMWATGHPLPNLCVFGDVKFHCDVPNRMNGVEWSAPFANIAWDIPRFRGQFDAFVQPEFFSPTGDITSGSYDSVNPAMNLAIQQRGGVSFYFELPWRATSHKMGYWFEDDAISVFAYAFMKGIGGVAGWDLFSPDIEVEATGTVTVTGVQSRAAFGTTALTGTASLSTTGQQGRTATSTTAITGTATLSTTGLAQFPGLKFGSTSIYGDGLLFASGTITLSPDRFGTTAILAYGILTTSFTGTGTLVRARSRVHVSI